MDFNVALFNQDRYSTRQYKGMFLLQEALLMMPSIRSNGLMIKTLSNEIRRIYVEIPTTMPMMRASQSASQLRSRHPSNELKSPMSLQIPPSSFLFLGAHHRVARGQLHHSTSPKLTTPHYLHIPLGENTRIVGPPFTLCNTRVSYNSASLRRNYT